MIAFRWLSVGVILGLIVASCTSTTSPERRLQIACSSYAEILDALAIRNRLGLLSGDAQDRIDVAVSVVTPVCEEKVAADPRRVLNVVESALIVMIDERERANGG